MSAVDAPMNEAIRLAEAVNLTLPQIDLRTRHYFANGLYAREIFIPAGTGITGGAHKSEHLSLCHGDITVVTAQGPRRITGHVTLVCPPGMKRIGYAHSDTWWTTFHAMTETDLEKIEELLTDEAPMLQTRCLAVEAEVRRVLED